MRISTELKIEVSIIDDDGMIHNKFYKSLALSCIQHTHNAHRRTRVRTRGLIERDEIDDTPHDDLTCRAPRRNRQLNARSTLAQHTRAKIAPTSRADTGWPRERRAKRQEAERRKRDQGRKTKTKFFLGGRERRENCALTSPGSLRGSSDSLFLSLSLATTLSRRLCLSAWKGKKRSSRFP